MVEDIEFGYVVGRVFLAVGDTVNDPARNPDLVPPTTATVTFTPITPLQRANEAPEPTALVLKQRIDCRVNSDGYVVDPTQTPGVWLVTGQYSVRIFTNQPGDPPLFYIEVGPQHTEASPLDLMQHVPNQTLPTPPLVIEGPIGPEGPMGPRGPKGDKGDPGEKGDLGSPGAISNGMTVIEHGADTQFPRTPDAVAVYWIGSVEPSNATDNDLWIGEA